MAGTPNTKILKILWTCNQRLEYNSKDTDALFTKGVVLATLGRYRESLMYLNRVIRINPQYPGIWRAKARLYEAIDNRVMADYCSNRGADGFK